MKLCIEERVLKAARYFVNNKSTLRKTAKVFAVSKATVLRDLRLRLPSIDKDLAEEANSILELNKAERYARGGYAHKAKAKAIKL